MNSGNKVNIKKRNIGVNSQKAKSIIKKQNDKCYWCSRDFGIFYIKNNTIKSLQIHIDHITPFSYTRTSEISNLVASCNLCNSFKSNKHFQSEEDCYLFLQFKWAKSLKSKKIILVK